MRQLMSTTFPIGPEVNSDQLARIPSLPVKPAFVELVGPRVRLIPTEAARDAASLFAMSNGEPIQLGERSIGAYDASTMVWRYLRYGPFANAAECEASLSALGSGPDILTMTLLDRESDLPIGTLSF